MILLIWLVLASAALAQTPAKAGKYEVTLRLPTEGLSAQEEMQIEYRVVDTARVDPLMGPAPVIRAKTSSRIGMPAMPSMPSMEEAAHPEGIPGEYGVHPVFPHGGEYRLTLHITPPGESEFVVDFPLQVTDAKARKPKLRPYNLELKASPKSPQAGEPAELSLVIRKREPAAIVKEFDRQHEKLMHLIVVRNDLAVFAHEHPELGPDGTFRLTYSFPTPGEYHLFADAAPRGAGGQVLLAKLKVGGKNSLPAPAPSTLRVDIATSPAPLAVGRTLLLPAHVFDRATSQPVNDLELYLGALGHLILLHEDAETFVHCHPDELDPKAGKDGHIAFLARFPKPGKYRGWAQFQRAGKIETVELSLSAQ